MALTVVFNGTRITQSEAADDTYWADHQGGGGGGQDVDNYIEGAQARGRKSSGGVRGYSIDYGTKTGTIDVDQAEDHIGMYIYVNTPAVWQTKANGGCEIRLGSGTDYKTDYKQWKIFGNDNRPPFGGWFPFWFEINTADTADSSNGTLNTSALKWMGCSFNCSAITGNFFNTFIDTIQIILGTAAAILTGTGTGGTFDDFMNFDTGTSGNFYGVVEQKDDVYLIHGRIQIGTSASSAVFDDSDEIVLFGDQPYVTDTFMGIEFNIENASSNIDISGMTIASTTTVRGDVEVVGTSGDFDADGCTFSNLRKIITTSAATFSNCKFDLCGQITGEGNINGSTISNSLDSSALLWNSTEDPNGELDDTTWISDGTGHAIELGSSTPSTITLTRHSYTGYGADDTTDATIYNNSGKSITINVTDGDTPTIRNGSGASTTVNNSVDINIYVEDENGTAIQNAQTAVYKSSDDTQLMNEDTNIDGLATESFNYSVDTNVYYRVRKGSAGATKYVPFYGTGTITSSGMTTSVILYEDTINQS